VLEVDRNLKVTEEVIRHLLVKRDPKALAAQRAKEAHAAAAAPEPEAGEVASEPIAEAEENQEPIDTGASGEEEPIGDEERDDVPAADAEEEDQA
jgi:small subunit ribosomal protein S6